MKVLVCSVGGVSVFVLAIVFMMTRDGGSRIEIGGGHRHWEDALEPPRRSSHRRSGKGRSRYFLEDETLGLVPQRVRGGGGRSGHRTMYDDI